jgi:hypothetical protein
LAREEILTPLLAFATDSSSDIQSDFAMDSSSDMQQDLPEDLPEAKLDLQDAELSLRVLLGSPLISLASPNSVLIPLKLNLL